MTILLRISKFYNKLNKGSLRRYSSLIKRELEVPTFCDVNIDLPYNIEIKPLNVHKYHNCDKLIIKYEECCGDSLLCDINGNQINIKSSKVKTPDDQDMVCSIQAPVKANLYVHTKKNINVGYFQGDNLYLSSIDGNINIDKYQGNEVKLTTYHGDIIFKDFIQAANIVASVMEKGSISCGRLQGLNLILKTKEGNISVESSYSHDSHFEIVKGNLDLHNVHKSCKIFLHKGHINLVGFDGRLKIVSEEGPADIQLARITEDSEINILNGALNLKVADSCQDYTRFQIKTRSCKVSEDIRSKFNNINGVATLIPNVDEDSEMFIHCEKGPVIIESASWQDMIKMKLKMKK